MVVVVVNATEGISSQNKMSHTPVIQGNKKNTPPNSSTKPGIQSASQKGASLKIFNALFHLVSAVSVELYISFFNKIIILL